MQIDQSIVLIFILIFTALTLALIALLLAFVKVSKNYMDTKEGKDKYPDPKILLLRAHVKSQKIIEEAVDKASQIVSSSEALKTSKVDNIEKEIEKADAAYLKIYQESIAKIQNESLKGLQNLPDYIKALLSKEALGIKDELSTEIKKAQEDAKQLVLEAYKKADQEVASYRKMRLDALDNTIVNIVQAVSRKVLTREIDANEHEKLVMKALEEAKKQNVFASSDIQDEGDSEVASNK
jgi:hypothetical protein